MIDGKTQLLGVIGYPIAHSLSPVMHNAALAHLGANYVYLPFAIHPEALEPAIQGFAAIGVRGFSVTIPHKQAILPYLTEVSEVAQAIGAVNTVWRTETGWSGTNTDVVGFLAPLQAIAHDWSQTQAVVLGCGGAARAVVAGCAQLGCQSIMVIGRDAAKLAVFHASWQNSDLGDRLLVDTWEQLPNRLVEANLLVNTTPVGMHPQTDASPLTVAEIAQLPSNSIVYDLIYTPNPTQLLKLAAERGLMAIDGLEMLVQQGSAALQIWLQQEVPVDVMRQALRQALGFSD
ncbi:MAG TPA: shikimate dehydrogenase [Leptolyngbyaceae cyanobacterium M33_DOE_097]|uniref:Shikimate dehydrogenase (NADP(+)) n=1 Tax=Oscillatoriales cyanobacterium SpSt-418 TaxID=2282169 RepID=A0A7C3PJR8_9CYAN|nr:shikimate dehydrogenase [Leptolyngbyaceae cyanobacterium M33_DOE_097]